MYDTWIAATDDSEWQGPDVDYEIVRASGVRAVWHRCGYGDDLHPRAARLHMGKDGCFDRHRADAHAAGLLTGAYFFGLPHVCTAGTSYDAVMRYTGGDPGDLPFMVTMEDPPGVSLAAELGAGPLADWMHDLGARLHAAWGPCIAYVGAAFGMAADVRLLDCYRWNWTPGYGSFHDYSTEHGPAFRPTWAPRVHEPWAHADLFQHSGENGRVPGYPGPVDIVLVEPDCWADMTGEPRPVAPPRRRPESSAAAEAVAPIATVTPLDP